MVCLAHFIFYSASLVDEAITNELKHYIVDLREAGGLSIPVL